MKGGNKADLGSNAVSMEAPGSPMEISEDETTLRIISI